MTNLFESHRLNRCETFQVKLPDANKALGASVQIKLIDTDKRSMTKKRRSLFRVDERAKRFSLISQRFNHADMEVRVVTKADIAKLRRMGYEVEVVKKLASCPKVKRIDGSMPTLMPVVPCGKGGAGSVAHGGIGGLGAWNLCHAIGDGTKGNGGSHPLPKGRVKSAKAAGTAGYQCYRQQLRERFLVLVKKTKEVMQELDDLRVEIDRVLPLEDIAVPLYNIFQPFVDEEKLSSCFYTVFQKFFGALPTEKLEGGYRDPIDLIAYLFILVEWEELGNYVFSDKCKKPFFGYVNEKVLVERIDVTERTFHNRLTVTMGDFRKKLSKEPISSRFNGECWKNDMFIRDFLRVIEVFHETEYYKELSRNKRV